MIGYLYFLIGEVQTMPAAGWFLGFGAIVLFLIIRRAFSISLKRRAVMGAAAVDLVEMRADPVAFVRWTGWRIEPWQKTALRRLAGCLIVLPIYGCGNDPK